MGWQGLNAFLNSDAGGTILLILFVAVTLYFNSKADRA